MTHKDIAHEAVYEFLEQMRAALHRPNASRQEILKWAEDAAPSIDPYAACMRVAISYDAIAVKAQKDSYARDRAESMARACRECAQEVGR